MSDSTTKTCEFCGKQYNEDGITVLLSFDPTMLGVPLAICPDCTERIADKWIHAGKERKSCHGEQS